MTDPTDKQLERKECGGREGYHAPSCSHRIVECWNCHGEGIVYSCFEEFACIDPEGGCDDCVQRCDVCEGRGGWPLNEEGTNA